MWVKWWSESAVEGRPKHPLGLWIGVAILLGASAVGAVFIQIWVMLVITVPKSSAQLHKQLLHTVMRAPLAFFVNTDSGITLNRFSNDMSVIETSLAGAVMQVLGAIGLCVAGAALIAAGSRYAAVMMPLIVLVIYMIQRFYLRTSRQLRFMDLEVCYDPAAPFDTCIRSNVHYVGSSTTHHARGRDFGRRRHHTRFQLATSVAPKVSRAA